MKTLETFGMSIGDYAESLMKKAAPEILKPKAKTMESLGPDLSNIELTEENINQFLGKKNKPSTVVKPKSKSPDELVYEFHQLLIQAKSLIKEMTSVGMLGVNQAGPEQSNPMKSPKVKSSKNKKKSAKFDSCVKRIKSSYGMR